MTKHAPAHKMCHTVPQQPERCTIDAASDALTDAGAACAATAAAAATDVKGSLPCYTPN